MTTKILTKKKHASDFKHTIHLSFGEEIGNAVTHGVAALIALIALPYGAVHAYLKQGAMLSVGVSIFVISIFLMFISSTIYHVMAQQTSHKYVMRIIDHSMIYVAICGSYTPVCLVLVGGWLGWTVMAILWSMLIWGILYKALAKKVNHKLSLAMYLIMGWVGVLLVPFIISKASMWFFIFVLLEGITYSIGAWFYAQKTRPYFHMIWHFFIMIAAVFHFIAVLYFM